MRLGLALHKSVGEIQQLTYKEWKKWYVMYVIEPWGWRSTEEQVARILAKLHNVNASKQADVLNPQEFIRENYALDVIKWLETPEQEYDFEDLTEEDVRALKLRIAHSFGASLKE